MTVYPTEKLRQMALEIAQRNEDRGSSETVVEQFLHNAGATYADIRRRPAAETTIKRRRKNK